MEVARRMVVEGRTWMMMMMLMRGGLRMNSKGQLEVVEWRLRELLDADQ